MIHAWSPTRFANFAAIDWSGAAGERHAGIAVAVCAAGVDAPMLVRPGHRWSREEVLGWLMDQMPGSTLVGLDLGAALPFIDVGAYFPGWPGSPPDARALWALVDELAAADPHLTVTSVVDHPDIARYFRRHGGRRGDRFGEAGRGRFRQTEHAQERQGCRPYSNFNLVGAAQVGKSSLTGMRLLHRLGGRLPVWPFDPVPTQSSVVVEIYTAIAAMAAGRSPGRSKMRDPAALDAALAALGSAPAALAAPVSDHIADALVTAAWLRRAALEPALWQPPGLAAVAATEGWTFGAR